MVYFFERRVQPWGWERGHTGVWRPGAATAIALSVLGHGALLVLWGAAPRVPPRLAALPITLELFRTPPPPPPPVEVAVVRSSPRQRSRETEPPRSVTITTPAPEAAPPVAEATAEPRVSRSSAKIDLVPHGELARLAAASIADPGGHLRRAGDGPAAQDGGGGGDDRQLAAGRVHDMVDDLLGRERVRAGKVPTEWRAVERGLSQNFHPPVDAVKVENRALGLAHQIMRSWLDGPPKSEPLRRGERTPETLLGAPEGMNMRSLPQEQALAIQARWGEPASWLTVEIEVVTDAEGAITKLRVVRGSGRRAFDKQALAAVEAAVKGTRRPPDGHGALTRWAVSAAVAVAPPTSIGFQFDETGQLNPGATGIRKYASGVYPFKETVKTKVELLRFDPQ